MNVLNAIKLFDLSESDPKLKKFIEDLNLDPELEKYDDDYSSDVSDPGKGFSLGFQDKHWLLEGHENEPMSGEHLFMCVQLFDGVKDDYARFEGTLPHALSFDLSQEKARILLGIPKAFGEAEEMDDLGIEFNDWDLWEMKDHVLHLEYSPDKNSVRLITISSKFTLKE